MKTKTLPEEHLTSALFTRYPLASAKILETLSPEETASLLSSLNPQIVAPVFQHMLPQSTLRFLQVLSEQAVSDILGYMSPWSAVMTMHFADHAWRAGVLGRMNSRKSATIMKSFSFEEGTAGRLANPHVPIMTGDRTVSDAIQWVQNHPDHVDHDLYIVDRRHCLLGVVSMKDLLITDLDVALKTITKASLETLQAQWSLAHILQSRSWSTYHTLPVVDSQQIFLGIINYQSLLRLQNDTRSDDRPGPNMDDTCQTTRTLPQYPPGPRHATVSTVQSPQTSHLSNHSGPQHTA